MENIQPSQNLFTETLAPNTKIVSQLGGMGEMSQLDKEAILRQIHPIFLTAPSEEKIVHQDTNFDKVLSFMRLCLEGVLKFIDIFFDAAIQIARIFVWIVAIIGILIVVTLMTNTTSGFIDILNDSIFPAIGLETKIQKVETPITPVLPTPDTATPLSPLPEEDTLDVAPTDLESNTLGNVTTGSNTKKTLEEARKELIEMRKLRNAQY